jgi:hypothetical protein
VNQKAATEAHADPAAPTLLLQVLPVAPAAHSRGSPSPNKSKCYRVSSSPSHTHPISLNPSAQFHSRNQAGRDSVTPLSRPWNIHREHRRTIVNASVTHSAPAAHLSGDVPGRDRLLGRTQPELADAMTWLAWYAPGIFSAVMDYMDHVDGELALATV